MNIANELKKGVKFMKANPDYTKYRVYRESGLEICLYWEGGYDPKQSDVIHASDEPEYALVASVKVENPSEWDGAFLDYPMDKNGEILTESISISPYEDYNKLSNYLLNELKSCLDNMTTDSIESKDKNECDVIDGDINNLSLNLGRLQKDLKRIIRNRVDYSDEFVKLCETLLEDSNKISLDDLRNDWNNY